MNKKRIKAGKMDMGTLDSTIEQILTQASGDDDVFQAFGQLIKDTVNLPADGFVIGEPVVITEIEYSGNARRGLTATCRREDGSDHVIALSEVMFPGAFTGGQADLRCLDAHSHLGNFVFDYYPQKAVAHYEVGLRIGELSLGDNFTGVLAWGFVDNRPFLRCMQGYGLCLWRMGRFKAAEQIFTRMLWLNPSDNQGARFLLDEVKAGITWEDSQNRN
jgi:tetratricopeptide (TPR) repeat protein